MLVSVTQPSPASLVAQDSKESACNAGAAGLIPELGRSPREGKDNPLEYSCLVARNPMDRSLVCYNPWSHKELDTVIKRQQNLMGIMTA